MNRGDLSDAEWAIIGPLLPAERGRGCRPAQDNRRFLNGMLHVLRAGCPWRDMHERYGKWNSVYVRFRDWVKADVFQKLFDAISDDPDLEYAWSTPPSSKSTATGRAQKGDAKPGHRPV